MRKYWNCLVWNIAMRLYFDLGDAMRFQREYPVGSFAHERAVMWEKMTMLKIKLWESFIVK